MTPILAGRLNNPFDAYEVELMTMAEQAQLEASEWAAKAQSEFMNDRVALHSYVEHMAALGRARAYGNALFLYRRHKAVYAGALLIPQKDQTEEPISNR